MPSSTEGGISEEVHAWLQEINCHQLRSGQRRYTLAEAWLDVSREECRVRGHDYEVVDSKPMRSPTGVDTPMMAPEGPQAVLCRRCGKSWGIEQ